MRSLSWLLPSMLVWIPGVGAEPLTPGRSPAQEAFMAAFLVFMPAMLLSGFMFQVGSMPEIFQAVTPAEPLATLPADRARPLPQGRLGALRQQFLALLAMGAGLAAAAWWFQGC